MPTDETSVSTDDQTTQPTTRTRRRAASRPAGPPESPAPDAASSAQTDTNQDTPAGASDPQAKPPAKKATRKRATKKSAAPSPASATPASTTDAVQAAAAVAAPERPAVFAPIFQPPQPVPGHPAPTESTPADSAPAKQGSADTPVDQPAPAKSEGGQGEGSSEGSSSSRRRRSRGGRSRRKSSPDTQPVAPGDESGTDQVTDDQQTSDSADATSGPDVAAPDKRPSGAKTAESPKEPAATSDDEGSGGTTSPSSRRRRRRRRGSDTSGEADSTDAGSPETQGKAREPRTPTQSITGVEGSTRIEAKKQRRREGREAGRRRPPILSESEFLARRESVDRVMVIRQHGDVTQIAVLEDNVLVEHYVALDTQSSLIGNVYLGRVQNVLPSMEAAFIDIGKGRNAVLYAGEVNWDLIGDRNQPRRIENALKSGQQVLVQVSKDPVGHKGARLTSQISLPGRYLVYVPGGGSSGISRKLPDTERNRLKTILKDILPDESGVIIRTAAEGASEEELTRDVSRLTSRWAEIEKQAKSGKAPALLYAEPDITLKVVRDLFTEDFNRLVVSGEDAWTTVHDYVEYVAPDLLERLERHEGSGDAFADFRVDEQIAKALERKVWLPSGGSLVIDRTEAMTVIDVNTGKFTGSGGNLEETVTKNNLEAAEELVRQLRLRDVGGIIVIDFIDMVLETNRDLVLRRLVECLGRDRTRHQVAEITSLGLVQMTRKRIGTGLVEAFSVPCEHCHGRGVVIESEPVHGKSEESAPATTRSSRRGRSRTASKAEPSADPKEIERHHAAVAATAAIAAALHAEHKSAAWADGEGDSAEPDESVDAVAADLAPDASRTEPVEESAPGGAEPAAPVPPEKRSRTRASKSASTAKAAKAAKKPTAKKTTAKKATAKRATKKAVPVAEQSG